VAFVRRLRDYVRVRAVCPERAIDPKGYGDPLRIIASGGRQRLINLRTGKDLTRKAENWSEKYLEPLEYVDGFILKHGSRLCGSSRMRTYPTATTGARSKEYTIGYFARQAIASHPQAAVIDSPALLDPRTREHWLTRLFAVAEFRAVRKANSRDRLTRLHQYYHTLLEAYSSNRTRQLDKFVQKLNSADDGKAFAEYDRLFHQILTRRPPRKNLVEPMHLALEHYRPHLTSNEIQRFKEAVEHYKAGELPLSQLRKTVQVWAVRYDKTFVREHAYFRPYPQQLA
jgi:uncharacterized protein YbgA (DUF1722 family)/uncharacterized protein YbbK (DUF523 family)